jgi:hypothetical protein
MVAAKLNSSKTLAMNRPGRCNRVVCCCIQRQHSAADNTDFSRRRRNRRILRPLLKSTAILGVAVSPWGARAEQNDYGYTFETSYYSTPTENPVNENLKNNANNKGMVTTRDFCNRNHIQVSHLSVLCDTPGMLYPDLCGYCSC